MSSEKDLSQFSSVDHHCQTLIYDQCCSRAGSWSDQGYTPQRTKEQQQTLIDVWRRWSSSGGPETCNWGWRSVAAVAGVVIVGIGVQRCVSASPAEWGTKRKLCHLISMRRTSCIVPGVAYHCSLLGSLYRVTGVAYHCSLLGSLWHVTARYTEWCQRTSISAARGVSLVQLLHC